MAKRNLALTRRVIEGLDDGGGVAPARSPLRVWQVTAVDTETGTCTIKMVASATGTLLKIGEHSNVLYAAGNAPSVGAQGLLVRLTNGTAMFFAGGGGGSGCLFAVSLAYMDNDVYLYPVAYVNTNGTHGGQTTAARPHGVNVQINTKGFLIQTVAGVQVFVPLGIYDEVRSIQIGPPTNPIVGQRWQDIT